MCIISIIVFLKSKICSVLWSKKSYYRKCRNNFKNLLMFNSSSLVCLFLLFLFIFPGGKEDMETISLLFLCLHFHVLKNISGSRDFCDPVLCKPLFYTEN